MENWKDGILEGWSNEAGKEVPFSKFHYSIIPTLQYSTIPLFPSLWDDRDRKLLLAEAIRSETVMSLDWSGRR